MPMRSYEILQAIAEEGNLSLAAERLGVTQPYLSQYLRRLEESYGVVILDRHKKPMILTPMGEVLLESRRQIARIEEATRNYCADLTQLRKGKVRVACNGERTAALLVPAVTAFNRAYPGIALDFSLELDLESIPEKLSNGKADVGVLYQYLLTPDLNAYPLFPERYLMTVPDQPGFENLGRPYNDAADYPLLKDVDPTPLKNLPLVQTYIHHERTPILSRAVGFELPEIDMALPRLGTRLAFVAAGLCWAVCQEHLIKPYSAKSQCRFVSLEGVLPVQTVVVAWNDQQYQSLASREFCRIVKETIGKKNVGV